MQNTPQSLLVRVFRPTGIDRLEAPVQKLRQRNAAHRREIVLSIPKRFKRYVSAVFKLGHTKRIAKEAKQSTLEQDTRLAALRGEIDEVRHEIHAQADVQNTQLDTRLAEYALYNNELSRRLDRLMLAGHFAAPQSLQNAQSSESSRAPDGFQLFMDTFYNRLENRFRGTPEDIRERLRVYQPDVEAATIRTGGKPVLDLGCGRGEWLQLMQALGIPASGVDLNTAQIAEAADAGLDAKEMDAKTALTETDDNSLSAITAYHLIEHIPFPDVAWIAREALRVLAPGGVLIFETPNPRNVLVGATSFHNDPTHLRPLTDPVLGVLFETAGYNPVETRFLHPHERLDEFQARSGFDPELAHLLFGPQDLAMIGQKPRERP